MGMAEFRRAIELIRGDPEADFQGPRPDRLVSVAEVALGIRFPPTYRSFLLELGAGNLGGSEVYGVIGDDFERSSIPDGIWATLQARTAYGLPSEYVVVGSDGMGSDIVLDSSHADPSGEYRVVAHPGGAAPDVEVLADDFGTYLLRLVESEHASR